MSALLESGFSLCLCCMEQTVRSRSTDVESCGHGSFLPGVTCLHEGNQTLFSNQSLVRFH
jgi:hypothetical protein